MEWNPWPNQDYRDSGVGNGDSILEGPSLTGAWHPTAGEMKDLRNAAQWVPDRGQAASAPPVTSGAWANDADWNPVLEGHKHSAVAGHPDATFAQNTAATSDHSLRANFEAFLGGTGDRSGDTTKAKLYLSGILSDGELGDEKRAGGFKHIESLDPRGPDVTETYAGLKRKREARLESEVTVKDAPSRSRWTSLFTREWSGQELGMVGIGLYALGSYFF